MFADAKDRALLFTALGAACALVPALAMWGFTVDDAWIPVRYAQDLVFGAGYRFHPGGPATDGVTPLPWPFVLAPLAREDAIAVLDRAKVLGIALWTIAGALLGRRLSAAKPMIAVVALALVALAFPIGAWAGAGLETGVVIALATGAALAERPKLSAALAGLAAAFRPEMLPWALALAIGLGLISSRRDATIAGLAAFAPFLGCVVLRLVFFGRPMPLSVLAKPSDLEHGLVYAGAASVVLLLPLAALSPVTIARGAPRTRAIAIAFVVHVLAVAAAGGDWMPYARLVVPVTPALALVVADVAARSPRLTALRVVLATALGGWLAFTAAPPGRNVMHDREDLVLRARPVLANAKTIAALDIGWVSAASGAPIVDLAGLTDPAIAILPGGHTSKRVDVPMLLDRGVDTVVIYSSPRVVEQRILRTPLFAERFERTTTLALGTRGDAYDVYVLRPR